MIYTNSTKIAMNIMFSAHQNQLDKGGVPYAFHPFFFAEQMNDETTTIVALLHDVIEDTNYTLLDLQNLGFSNEICEAVHILTRENGQDYFDYIARIKQNPIAKIVKIADLKHNSDLTRLNAPTKNDLLRVEKYIKALSILLEN